MADSPLDVKNSWDCIRRHLPANYATLADEHKQLQLQYGNAKIRTADDLLRLILLHAGADLPLRQTVAMMAEAGGPEVSHVRLHKKMIRARPYLQALLGSMVGMHEAAPELWSGYDVVTTDATAVCGPGATTTDARIHTQMRVADLELVGVHVAGLRVGETFKHFGWQEGQLAVADSGYCNASGIGHVVRGGADVLVRVNRTSLPVYDEDERSVDLIDWMRDLDGFKACEQDVWVEDKQHDLWIRGRLIGLRLPSALAEKARARLRREMGRKATPLDMEAAQYVVLFTTVPKSRLNADRCLALYRLRWQIELLFKRWKSLCGLDRLPNQLDETIHSWLYAKLLLALLAQRMAGQALSPPVPSSPTRRRRRARMDTPTMEAGIDAVAGDHIGAGTHHAA